MLLWKLSMVLLMAPSIAQFVFFLVMGMHWGWRSDRGCAEGGLLKNSMPILWMANIVSIPKIPFVCWCVWWGSCHLHQTACLTHDGRPFNTNGSLLHCQLFVHPWCPVVASQGWRLQMLLTDNIRIFGIDHWWDFWKSCSDISLRFYLDLISFFGSFAFCS